MWKRTVALLGLGLALGGCSVAVTEKSEKYDWVNIPVGSKVVLHQDVQIQPGWSRVFIQNGEVVAFNDVQEFYPYCNFEVRTLAEQGGDAIYIRADTFETGSVHRRSVMYQDGQMLAQVIAPGARDARSNRTLNTEVKLSSQTQPDVRKLICSVWADPIELDAWVTIDKMRNTLGGLATIEIAGG